MAHDIYQDRRMFFTGATPWHNLGVKLPANATWEQARDAAGFYDVVERPVFAAGIPTELRDVKALIAADDGRYLATVGKDYGVVQFSEMAKAVIEAAGGANAIFHTGGLLGDVGATGWLLGELPQVVEVKGGDVIRPYFLAYSGHDGRTPVTLANCATRVVCRNTLGSALREKGGFRTSIRHTSNAAAYVNAAAAGFRALQGSFQRLGAWANKAAERRLTASEVREAIVAIHPTPEHTASNQMDRINAIHDRILTSYEEHEIGSTKGTAWALFNAMQGYAEHHAPTRSRLQLGAMTDTARAALIAERGFFGAGASGGEDALRAVCAAANLPHPAAMTINA